MRQFSRRPDIWCDQDEPRSLPPGAGLLIAAPVAALFWSAIAWVVLT